MIASYLFLRTELLRQTIALSVCLQLTACTVFIYVCTVDLIVGNTHNNNNNYYYYYQQQYYYEKMHRDLCLYVCVCVCLSVCCCQVRCFPVWKVLCLAILATALCTAVALPRATHCAGTCSSLFQITILQAEPPFTAALARDLQKKTSGWREYVHTCLGRPRDQDYMSTIDSPYSSIMPLNHFQSATGGTNTS